MTLKPHNLYANGPSKSANDSSKRANGSSKKADGSAKANGSAKRDACPTEIFTSLSMTEPRIGDICKIFDTQFIKKFHTCLLYGYDEPLYKPSTEDSALAEIRCNQNYVASALHECAHWCIAGSKRRQLIDYGYWYEPDGRAEAQQCEFERVEVKPQALEWIFSQAVGMRFCLSADNLDSGIAPSVQFKEAILNQVINYCNSCAPKRAYQFALALAVFYQQPDPFNADKYSISDLN